MIEKRNIWDILPDEQFLRLKFWFKTGKVLNITKPKTFNEKLQWLKLYDRNPEYTKMVDKYEAKKYVADVIGEEYIIPTIGVWNAFDEIDFSNLPDKFVLKCTHDSGGVVIVSDKNRFDKNDAKRRINDSLRTNYYMKHREWPYKDVVRRIIAEEYMVGKDGGLIDYKFMCFNGNVKCSFTCSDRFQEDGLKVTFFDRYWNKLPFERKYPASNRDISRPVNYELMINLAEKLSKGIPFLRVDFYEIDGKVYFGELTFFPGSGFEPFSPKEWDYKLGDWLCLPK